MVRLHLPQHQFQTTLDGVRIYVSNFQKKTFMYEKSHSETDHILAISWYLLGQTINVYVYFRDRTSPSTLFEPTYRHILYYFSSRTWRFLDITFSAETSIITCVSCNKTRLVLSTCTYQVTSL